MLHVKTVLQEDIMFNIKDIIFVKSIGSDKTLLKINGLDESFIIAISFSEVKKALNVNPRHKNKPVVNLKLA